MTYTLRLTADEQKILEFLPKALTEGVQVETEDRSFKDNEQHFRTRWSAVRFESEKLRTLERQSTSKKSQEEIKSMIEQADLKDLSHDDLVGLFFIAGPETLGLTIAHGLTQARSAEDVADVAELANIRTILLNAFIPA